MKTHDLLPCAHCGHEARRVPRFCMGYAGDGVKCPNCHAETPSWVTGDKAVKWWNRRAEQPTVKESLTTEQPEDGPVAWMACADGRAPGLYVGSRPPSVADGCSVQPLYPESVKAERDALREYVSDIECEREGLYANVARPEGENAELRERVKELGDMLLNLSDAVLDDDTSREVCKTLARQANALFGGDTAMQEGTS